ncbi:MAG TPA: hypothetical protein VG937_29495 [Polyangiaceae bacterium]|nr:hypothetical protein [Polyangiaceae bacterium]
MMRRRARTWALVASSVFAFALAACAKKDDVVVQTGAGKELTSTAIDADALALLPPNAVGVLTVDAQALFASSFGARILSITQARSPLPQAAEFEPKRDIDRVHLGIYSMQGADIAGVALGRFKPEKIAKAAEENPRTPTGAPVTKSEYAGRALYTSRGIGFTVLTERTLLFGNETGMRRALDRIHEGRARRQLPKWMAEMLETKSAPLAGGADLTSQPVPAAARDQLAFLDGLKTASLLGNFEEPGLNLAGTLSYAEPEGAAHGADNLKQLHSRLATYAPFMALLGFPQPVRSLEVRAEKEQVKFVAGVDGAAVAVLLEKAESYLSTLSANAPASPPTP